MQNVLIVINLLLFTLIMTKHTVRQNRRGFFSTHRFSLHDILQSSQKKTESRRLVVGHGLTTFSATKFFCTILCFLKSQPDPRPLTTALRHYMTGPLVKSRLRPWDMHTTLSCSLVVWFFRHANTQTDKRPDIGTQQERPQECG